MDSKPAVCFFDSGIGGLPFLYASVQKISGYDFLYFADNHNVPYGKFTHEELVESAKNMFCKIAQYNPRAVVIACNTITAHCASILREKYKFPIVGVQPAVKPAAKSSENCIVLSTVATAKSENIKRLVSQYGRGITNIIACPDLAEYIERNIFNLDAGRIRSLLPKIKADAVVLGCTHYIYVKKTIEEFYSCPTFDGVSGTVNRLCSVLDFKSGKNTPQSGQICFICGDEIKNKTVFERVIQGI